MFNLLFSIHKLSDGVELLLLLRNTPSQTLFRSNDIAYFCVFCFLYRIQHVVFYRVLTLKFKNKAFVQFKCHLLLNILLKHLQLYVRLFHSLSNNFKTLWRNHERLLHPHLLRVNINGKRIIPNLVTLFLQKLLEVLIVRCPQRHHHSSLSLFLTLLRNLIEILLVHHHLKFSWRLTLGFLFLSDKHYFGQIFNSIRYDIIDELIVHPQKTHLQGLVSTRTSLGSDVGSGCSKSVQIWWNYLVQRLPLALHLPKDHLVSLTLFDYLGVLIEEVHLADLDLFWGVDVEHVTVVVLHRGFKYYYILQESAISYEAKNNGRDINGKNFFGVKKLETIIWEIFDDFTWKLVCHH